ncbi:glycoside hydrolase family 97 protein [Zunongwangia pacifica]|uniref:Glycoside hydrolase family 97 protein n=1 Tax=Zunongwangia pacifica TaxID=2911062 RepID=A0A9X1ZUN7_9FLAO|nr:glycoside hydrolase family 97 protein [Zunongwangia pacifica]MCL6219520.1 glycoside hydrolase family 97 protein [Zunongwangia pacifica]
MKELFYTLVFLTFFTGLSAQKLVVSSPNGLISVALHQPGEISENWYFKVFYHKSSSEEALIPKINLGLARSDTNFSSNLKLQKSGKIRSISEAYHLIHGKKSSPGNSGSEVTFYFRNDNGKKMNIVLRVYNDGLAFRYEFPEKEGDFSINNEFTSYSIPTEATRWLEKWNPANEGLYQQMQGDSLQGEWGYPALFHDRDTIGWYLIHEANLNRTYAGTKLSNEENANTYDLVFPNPDDGRGTGKSNPDITTPWESPWRVIMIGNLATVTESTLVTDVSDPVKLKDADWIEPGVVSWNYWSSNHGTKDYQTVIKFADLAEKMGWKYTLLDWEWDAMGNGGNLEDAVSYINKIGIKPLIWYNSGGDHTWVPATPKDRMLTHENRVEEFTKLHKLGIAGVKVDFFESEKQNMINYYLDIVEDAADFDLLVYFHGSLVPRGWSRTYPNLMTYEAVRGAEWYNNVPTFTMAAPQHNTILPFTRNVVGPMDYTPVTFTNSQFPHITSYGHELALGILFESGLQHMADRPEGYYSLPDKVIDILKKLPAAWDDTKFIYGYPGKNAALARRKGENWYLAGISSELWETENTISLEFLKPGIEYQLKLVQDGAHDKVFKISEEKVTSEDRLKVKLLRRGGFIAVFEPL